MIKNTKVTIVTVTYNANNLLEETIHSVLNQTYTNIEYIIIDGNSTDGTIETIKKYEDKIDYWVSEPDEGIYYAMNKAIEKSNGEWINFMNAGDSFARLDTIEYVMHHKNNEAELIYGNFLIKERETIKKAWNQSKWYLHMPFCHQTLFTKTDIMKKELFDTSFRLAADYNFIIKMYKKKKIFDYIDQTLAIFSLGGFSESNDFLMNVESLKVLVDHNVPQDEISKSYWYKAMYSNISAMDKNYDDAQKNSLTQISDLQESINILSNYSVWKNPLKKYRRYRTMLLTYTKTIASSQRRKNGISDLVSIIIPCYNQAQYLKESVQSAINQTYLNIEIIIVNDGSSDNSEKIASTLQKQYPQKIKVISQKNSGVSDARNNAIKHAKGKYILPLDADDLISYKMVESSLKSMLKHKADIVYVDIQCFGTKNNLIKKRLFSDNNLLYDNLCSVTSLFKKEIWRELKGYSKNMKEGYEDWEFWINAYKAGYKFQRLSEPLLLYRTKEESRNTKAEIKDAYLKSIIVLNHPELYTFGDIKNATSTIYETEALADLYFYSSKDLSIDDKHLKIAINKYLSSTKLKKKQIIDLSENDIKITLLSLHMVQSSIQIKQLIQETNTDCILFYSSIRYDVSSLKPLNFAWHRERAIMSIHGTIFPFIFKSKIKCTWSQLIAHQRKLKYLKYKHKINLITVKKILKGYSRNIICKLQYVKKKLSTI